MASPVLIHGFWRGGGTYLWHKFRAGADTLAFYEPFNEALGSNSGAEMLARTSTSWPSKHPLLKAPYLAEYAPLVRAGHLRHYRKEFAVASFFPEADGALPEAQCRHIAALLDYARRAAKRPVLGFSRSLGRVPGLRRAFQARHIVPLRNPAHQWMSCFAQCRDHGNDYFLVMHAMLAGQNRHDLLLKEVTERYDIPLIERPRFDEEIEAYRGVAARLPLEAAYRIFLAIYVAGYLEALPASDLVVDMDLLSLGAYRGQSEARISALTGIALDLGDAAMPAYPLRPMGIDFARCHEEALAGVLGHCMSVAQSGGRGEIAPQWPLFVLRAKLEEATRSYLEEFRAPGQTGATASAARSEESDEAMLLRSRLNQAASRLKAAERRLELLKRSTSWRATAPLRELVDLLRGTRGRGWVAALLLPAFKRAAPSARR